MPPRLMFKFIHAADPHLDSPLHGLSSHEGAPAEALRHATRRAFANLVDLAMAENVAFLVIAGDLYDGDWRDFGPGMYFTSQMARLHQAGIPVYLVAGNHDAASVITKSLPDLPNVRWLSTKRAESLTVPGWPVVIHGQGFAERKVPGNLAAEYPPAVPGYFNLGLLHTSLQGDLREDTYAPCSLEDLLGKHYHYWALGHIHQRQTFRTQPWIGFAGNLQGRHIKETGPHGCQLVTVAEDFSLEVEFRALDVVRWEMLTVDLAGVTSKEDALERLGHALTRALQAAESRLVAARIVFTGVTELHGTLHRQAVQWQHGCVAKALEISPDGFWLEQVKLATRPLVDPATLAERDDLTRLVLESMTQLPAVWPDDLQELLKKLPPELSTPLQEDLSAEPATVLAEVSAIILESLSETGGASA